MTPLSNFLKYLKISEKLIYIYGKIVDSSLPEKYKDLLRLRTFVNNATSLGFKVTIDNNNILLNSNKRTISLRRGTSDNEVFNQIFVNNEYQTLIDYININDIKVDTIIDAGANIGLSTIKFYNSFPNCKILCFEPDPENFKQLQINVSHLRNITAVQKALWYKSELLTLDKEFRDKREWSVRVTKQINNISINIPAISLREVINHNKLSKIDFLKIDIEGSEAEIFKEENDLAFLEIVKIIAIEIHDEFDCRSQIYKILKNNAFNIFNIGELTIGIKSH